MQAMSLWAQADRRHWDVPADHRGASMLYLGARLLKPLEMAEVANIADESFPVRWLLANAWAAGCDVESLALISVGSCLRHILCKPCVLKCLRHAGE